MKFPRAMYSFSTSFWVVPRELCGRHALLLADELVQEQQHRRGGVDRHRGRDLGQRDAVEHPPHVVDRVDGHAGAAHLARAQRVVRVAAELGGEVEGHREARRPVLDQVAEALVRLRRGGVARVLAHRPRAAAVHVGVDAAGERVVARLAEALLEVRLHVVVAVEVLDLDAGVGEAALVVGADDRRDARLLVGLRGHGGRRIRGVPSGTWRSPSACSRCCASAPAPTRSRSSCPRAPGWATRSRARRSPPLADGIPLVMAVNREYADAEHVLDPGDELALIPPVSGGSTAAAPWVRVSAEPLSLDALAERVRDPRAGAVVTFSGVTREVERLEYEAYAEMARSGCAAIAEEALATHGLCAVGRGAPRGRRAAVGAERDRGGVGAAPRRGVRGRPRDHRPREGRGADLEEGDRGRRRALGQGDRAPR